MSDIFPKEKRSAVMKAVNSRNPALKADAMEQILEQKFEQIVFQNQ